MPTLSPAARMVLVFIAAAVGFVAGYGIDGIPQWAEAVLGGLAAAFAAIGIIPPQYHANRDTRTVERKSRG